MNLSHIHALAGNTVSIPQKDVMTRFALGRLIERMQRTQ